MLGTVEYIRRATETYILTRAMASASACEEKLLLLEKYQSQVRVYSDAVIRIRDDWTSIPQVEFQVLWDLANRAYRRCDEARLRLQQHIIEHDC